MAILININRLCVNIAINIIISSNERVESGANVIRNEPRLRRRGKLFEEALNKWGVETTECDKAKKMKKVKIGHHRRGNTRSDNKGKGFDARLRGKKPSQGGHVSKYQDSEDCIITQD